MIYRVISYLVNTDVKSIVKGFVNGPMNIDKKKENETTV